MTLKGSTREFPLDVLVRLLTDTKKTGELSLRGSDGEGALGFADGRVVAAVHGEETPIPALGAVFEMGEADFEFTPWNDAPPANLEGELNDLLRKAKEHREWLASVREVIPSDRARFRLSERAAEQGAVTFTSDRWRVVLAVNGERNVTDIAANLRIERDAALNILAGLVRDGVIDVIEPQANAAPPAPSPPAMAEYRPMPSAPEPAPAPIYEPEPPAPRAAEIPPAPPAYTEPAPMPRASAPEWTAPAPAPETPAQQAPAPTEWTMPAQSAPAPAPAPETPTPPDWSGMPTSAPVEPRREDPIPSEWGAHSPNTPPAPAPAPAAPTDWAPAAPAAPGDWQSGAPAQYASTSAPAEPAPQSMEDRLAALFGSPAAPSAPTAPATDWSTPAPSDWGTPPAATPSTPSTPEPASTAEVDPRLAALSMPMTAATPSAPASMPAASAPQSAPANEWAPATDAAAQPKKKGMFGSLFGGGGAKARPAAAPAAAGTPGPQGASRVGQLAAFANAMLAEYASGQYGKGKIDERMASLLMRVDEQADPIDRPLPVIDERLDVEALERVTMADAQAAPYLAMLVATIYADAEKAFGKDKAKRGYKTAQQQVFGANMSALTGPDLAGKLPKV